MTQNSVDGTGAPKASAAGSASADDVAVDHDGAVQHRKHLLGAVNLASWRAPLARFIASQSGVSGNVSIGNIHLPGAGGSSGTLMFTAEFDQGHGPAKRDLVLRYATEGGLFHDYDLPGQYKILQGLQHSSVPVPRVVGLDSDGAVLGVTGYVMERVEGEVPPATYYRSGAIFDASAENRRRMIFDVVATLAKLHALDWRTLGIKFLTRKGTGTTATERALNWYWSSLCWGCPDEIASLEPIWKKLLLHQPGERDVCLNHGDAMLANYMFRDHRVVAVLDWELAFLGNPANDVAYQIYTHAFLGMGCESLPGFPSADEWKAEYARVSGRALTDWNYYWATTAFKLHISLLLVYRNSTPELETSRRMVRQFTWDHLVDAVHRVENSGARQQ